jgi:hypothetical protein
MKSHLFGERVDDRQRDQEPLRILMELHNGPALAAVEEAVEGLSPPLLLVDRARLLGPFVYGEQEASADKLFVYVHRGRRHE